MAFWQLLDAQHGCARTSQGFDLGLTRGRVRSMIEAGFLKQICHGVVRAAASTKTFEQEVMVGVLLGSAPRSPGGASAYGVTAGSLLDMVEKRSDSIHIVSTRKLHHRDSYRFHWTTRLPESELILASGVPCTDPARTLLDLCDTEPALARWAYRRALRKGLLTPEGMQERVELEARRGRGGLNLARLILDETSDTARRAKSGIEDRFHDFFVRAGYPAPLRNVSFPSSFGHDWEIDIYFPQVKCGFEISPYETHGSPEVHARDGRKELDLARLGIRLWRFTEDLTFHEFVRAVTPILGDPKNFPSAEMVP